MTDKRLMSDLSWVEYEQRLAQLAPVLLPIGAVEQHGPHLPLGTDWMIALAVAKEAASQIDGIVAQPLTYGYKSQPHSGGGQHFCGTTSLDGNSLSLLVRDVLREFGRHGAKKVVIVDIHFENHWFVTEGCDLAIRELKSAGITDMRVIKPRLDAVTDMNMIQSHYPDGEFPGIALEHAGKLETSAMLYLYPQHVQTDKYPEDILADIPPYDVHPADPSHVTESGALAPTSGANKEFGKAVVENLIAGMVDSYEREFGGSIAAANAKRASSF